MKSFSCIVTVENGIHARPAGLLVKEAKNFKSKISLFHGESVADAKGLFSLMGLGVKSGDEVVVQVEGEDEEQAAEQIKGFLLEKFCSGGGTKNDDIKR